MSKYWTVLLTVTNGIAMTCISPPELTDLQIAMALDEDADAQIVAHLAQCPHCRENAQRLALVQNQLKRHFYRQFCLPPDTLRDYFFHLLSEDEIEEVSQHLALCPHCLRELFVDYADAIEVSAVTAETPGLLERFQLWVAQALDVNRGGLTSAFGTRQSEMSIDNESPLIYKVDQVQISIEIEPSFNNPDERMLVGLVSGLDVEQMDAHLWRESNLVATAPVDSTGSFEFSEMPMTSGQYELFLNGLQAKIHIPEIIFL
jgi:hypothetical protein